MSDFVQVKNFITDDECNDLIKFYDTYFSRTISFKSTY